MTHPKKSLKRTLFFTYLLLASFACKLSAFAGVAGRGIDPSVLEANAAGPGAYPDGASALPATTQSAASTAGQVINQTGSGPAMVSGTQTSAATTAAGAGQMTTQTGSGQAMAPGTQASAATNAAGAGQMTPQTGNGPAMVEAAGATANASSVSGALNGAPTGIPETQPVQSLLPPTEEEIANYFQGAYVTGDSVAYGFQLYANRQKANSAILQNLGFLTRGSFSAHNAFMTISKKSVHPTYQGAQHFIWDSLQMVGAKHVFMFFGLNDLNIGGVDSTVDYYVRLINQIRAVNPDIASTIISTTPMYQGSEKGKLTNANIDALNARMQALCTENGWGYLDIASHLKAANGTLAAQYCSDHYVHETNAAYAIWLQCFHDYAQEKLIAEKLDTQTKA